MDKRMILLQVSAVVAALVLALSAAAEQAPGPGAGGRGGPGRGGGGRGGAPPAGPATAQMIENALDNAVSLDEPISLDRLPYGDARRLVPLPVGGIDNFQESTGGFRGFAGRGARSGATGWKVEDIYTLTDEQKQALEKLRTQYKEETAKLQAKFDEANKAMAAEVIEARRKFEQLANDVLTGTAKEEKTKLDALAQEVATQRKAKTEEQKGKVTELRQQVEALVTKARADGNWGALAQEGWQKVTELGRGLREQRDTLIKDAVAKMKEIVTGDAKAKLEEALKKIEEQRGRFGPGGGGGGTRTPGSGQPPATAPDGAF
jgi:hypothetical protein